MASTLRTNGPSPEGEDWVHPLQTLRLFYLQFTQGLFAGSIEAYRWHPDNNLTRIVITAENTLRTEHMQFRPAICFTRGPVQSFRLGYNDVAEYDFATGQKKKVNLIPGTMSINCCARNPFEAENIAFYLAEHLQLNCEVMMRYGFFDGGRDFIVGSPSPPGSLIEGDNGEEWYVVTISSPFQLKRTAQYTPLGAHVLQHIRQGMNVLPQTHIPERGPNGMVGANLPYAIRETAPGLGPHQRPHPLDPTRIVTAVPYKPYAPR